MASLPYFNVFENFKGEKGFTIAIKSKETRNKIDPGTSKH